MMKTIFRTICACLALLGLSAHAAPIVQSGWTTTGVPGTARDALGTLAETNGQAYGTVSVGTLTTPALVNTYGTNQFWDTSGATSAKLWFEDPYFVFGQNISTPGINLNGDFRTTWPTLSGAFSPATNITVKSADNSPSPNQGAALILRGQETSTLPGVGYVAVEYLPAYTNNSYRGIYRHTIGSATNTLGDLLPDVLWNISYNGGGNSVGVSAFGLTDTNEPVWMEQKESRWQNINAFSQLEWWDYFATPYTEFGTNFGMRWFTGTLVWGTTNKNFVSANAKATVSTFDLQNPTGPDGIAGIRMSADSANVDSWSITVDGAINILTNDSGNGALLVKGGIVSARAPDSVTGMGGINFETDWNNSDSLRPHGLSYPNGAAKSFYFGAPGDTSKTYTNVVVASNFITLGFATFPRGISANSNVFTIPPTNVPGVGQIITATSTSGHTAWSNAPAGGGSGDTNGMSYVNGTDPQYTAWSVTAMHRLEAWFTNGVVAIGITNAAGNSWVSINDYTAGAEVARFTFGSAGFIDMGAYELRSGGDAHISFTSSGTTIYDNAENGILDFSNVGVPYLQLLAGAWLDSFGHVTTTNGTLAISPLLGTVAADNAPAGTYGEYVESVIAPGSAVSLTDATAANITSISLTAGDWDVEGNVNLLGTGATFTAGASGINTTTATLPTTGKANFVDGDLTGNFTEGMSLSRVRVNVSATTTVYLVGRATFSAGTVTGYGTINARRVR